MKNILKQKNGVTLITLVVTVIILIILAGVSVTSLIGNEGILTKGQNLKQKTTISQKEQEVEIAILEAQKNHNGNIDEVTLQEILNIIKNNYNTEEKNAIKVEGTGTNTNKLPAKITYEKAATGLDNNIEISVDENGNINKR